MLKRTFKTDLFLGVVAVFVASAFSVLSPLVQEVKRDRWVARESARIELMTTYWDGLSFSPVSSEPFRLSISNAVWGSKVSEQRGEPLTVLSQTLHAFFEYEAAPSFNSFMSNRTNDGPYEIVIRGNIAKLLTNSPANPDRQLGSRVSEVFQAWNLLREQNQKAGVDSLDAVALETVRVSVLSTTNRTIPTQAQAARECTFVARAFNSGLEYKDSPGTKRSLSKDWLFAQLSFVGKFSPSGKASPFFAVWFWSESSKKWRPIAMYFDMQCRYGALF